MLRVTIVAIAVAMGSILDFAKAQTLTRDDAKVEQILRERPDLAIFIVDARMRDENGEPMPCGKLTLSLAGEHGRVVRIETRVGGLFGTDVTDGGLAGIAPGLYLAAGITCGLGNNTHLFRGNFAKFTIRSGEIIAAGTVVLDYRKGGSFFKPTYSGSAHVEDFSPKTLASLKQRIPVTMTRAKRRLMTQLSEQEKRNGL
ncbi:hypothetical protein CI41S_51730 [Bradyrhizobium ivorense]|nr:hypothetical protein CI41S_51730 [Bradyrhizobium ivorense]